MPEKIKHISVLMPAYNCAKYIGQSIRSILNQSYKDYDFVIIDDGSTDNTEEVVTGFKDSRIVYKKTENKGTAAALNTGLKLCTGDWVARIDADDLNVPERLQTQVDFIAGNPGYDIISSWSVYFKDPAKILFLLQEPVEHTEIYDYFDLHNPINQSGMMFRKKIIKKEKYNEDFRHNEDYELLYRIRDTVKFYNIPKFLTYTRVRNDSKTFTQSNQNLYEMLFNPAFKKMIDAKSKGEHFYWASTIAWINYFYGSRKESRSYLRSSVSLKNTLAYFTTFLPEKYFDKFISGRYKYRLKYMFKPSSKYKAELKNLLKA